MSLTIVNGPPKFIGQRRRDHKFAPLHADKQPPEDNPRALTPEDIYADPKSSDDESSTKQEEADSGLSDDSLIGVARKKKGISQLDMKGKSEGCRSPKGESAEAAAAPIPNPPSLIASTVFTSKKPLETHTGSQSSQKRLRDETDDEMGSFGSKNFSQSKKPKIKTYGGSSNIHKGSAVEQKKPTKATPVEKRKERPAFRSPNANGALASLDRMQAEPEGSKKSTWKVPSVQSSPRAQRASQRSAKSTQESSQTSSKDFKQPLRLTPNKGPKFKAIPATCEEVAAPRATRASAPAKKPLLVADGNTFKSSELQNAFKTVTDKLGVSDMQMNPPVSAAGDSSAPPTSLDAATTVSSPLSSLDDSAFDSGQERIPIIRSEDIPSCDPALRPSTCPMCKQPVDKAFLEQYSKIGTRMSLRQQAQFCQAHKERTAESEWAERHYPNIDWEGLDARITEFHTTMDDILSRRKPSFYRNAFEDSLKSGKNKTIQESMMRGDEIEGTSPGYYGGRGAKVMAENILSKFTSKVRRLAASDKLISSGGVSRYVQAVLVPELAVLLVMDDMRVDEEKAREILRDSVDIGNLLNEEEDEIITDPAPEEREVVDMT